MSEQTKAELRARLHAKKRTLKDHRKALEAERREANIFAYMEREPSPYLERFTPAHAHAEICQAARRRRG
jgi:hypothetical protein